MSLLRRLRTTRRSMLPSRKTIHLGRDRFAVDSDGKVYCNGKGQVYPGSYLNYWDDAPDDRLVRKRIAFDILFKYLHEDDLEPIEAIRRTRIAISHTQRGNVRTYEATEGNKQAIYCVTTRRKYKSIKDAAGKNNFSAGALSQALKENREIKGLKFKRI